MPGASIAWIHVDGPSRCSLPPLPQARTAPPAAASRVPRPKVAGGGAVGFSPCPPPRRPGPRTTVWPFGATIHPAHTLDLSLPTSACFTSSSSLASSYHRRASASRRVVCPQGRLSLAVGINVRQESQGPATRCEQPMQASKISHVASPLSREDQSRQPRSRGETCQVSHAAT